MKKRITAVLLAAALMIIPFTSCNDNDEQQPPLASGTVIVTDDSIPDVAPNISGIITAISHVREGIMLTIEPNESSKRTVSECTFVTLTQSTVLEDKDKNRYNDYTDVKLGSLISVWFKGNATESVPSYAVAHGIRVMSMPNENALSISNKNNAVLASKCSSDVSPTDASIPYYGSYISYAYYDTLNFVFSSNLQSITLELSQGEQTTNIKLYEQNSISDNVIDLHIPADILPGDYTVTAYVDYSEGNEVYTFILHIE